MNFGKISSDDFSPNCWKGTPTIKGKQAKAQHQEERKLQDNEGRIQHECALAVPASFAAQQPLDQELIRSVRGHRQEGAAEQPSNQSVRRRQEVEKPGSPAGIDDLELVRSIL